MKIYLSRNFLSIKSATNLQTPQVAQRLTLFLGAQDARNLFFPFSVSEHEGAKKGSKEEELEKCEREKLEYC